jgi:hypothetical protein
VGCEIGLAKCRGIPIIAFEEDSMDFKENVDFPVPLVDHYFRYNQNPANSIYTGEVFRSLAFNVPFQNPNYPMPFSIKCPYDHCNAEYLYWNLSSADIEITYL